MRQCAPTNLRFLTDHSRFSARLANRAPNRLWGRRLESPSAGLEIARVGIPLPGLRIRGPIRVLEGTEAVISVLFRPGCNLDANSYEPENTNAKPANELARINSCFGTRGSKVQSSLPDQFLNNLSGIQGNSRKSACYVVARLGGMPRGFTGPFPSRARRSRCR